VKVLFDTNVILDVLLAREPHVSTAAKLFSLVDSERLDGRICATTVTTVAYLATKALGAKQAKKLVRQVLDFARASLPVFDPHELLSAVVAAGD